MNPIGIDKKHVLKIFYTDSNKEYLFAAKSKADQE